MVGRRRYKKFEVEVDEKHDQLRVLANSAADIERTDRGKTARLGHVGFVFVKRERSI